MQQQMILPNQPDTDTQTLTRAYERVQIACRILLTLPDHVSDTAYDAAIKERKQAYTEWHKARGY
jgi:hypothetical protein